jgi:serine/threonine protein kinase
MPIEARDGKTSQSHLQPHQRQRGTKQVDLFSLGCVIFYLLTSGRHPYGGTHYEREWRIARGEAPGLTLEALKGDDCALQLVRRCLEPRPENRIVLRELLRHPYFWYALRGILRLFTCFWLIMFFFSFFLSFFFWVGLKGFAICLFLVFFGLIWVGFCS